MPRNAAIVRLGYEALGRGDLQSFGELFGENVSWHTPGRSPLAGDVLGREAVFAVSAATRPRRAAPSDRTSNAC